MGKYGQMPLRENRPELRQIAAEPAVKPAGRNIFGDVDVLLTTGSGVRNLMQRETPICQLNPTGGSP